jgi:4-amino-4-deoxy-L-arabinose transferase-like glycosyltransferase
MTRASFWPMLFCGYFLLQVVVRLAFGPALELDEAEAFYFARQLALGYSAQPPLYFWLQWGVFQIVGESIFALAVLKAVLLSFVLVLLYRLLLRVVDPVVAGIGAASLALLPQILWEAQRALTHSVLVLCMAVLLFSAFWQVLERGRWRDYLVLGAVVGLGLLSKYNFALLPVALVLAALIMPELRGKLRWPRLAVALVIAGLMVAPTAFWALSHADVAGGSIHKLGMGAEDPVWARVSGTAAFVVGLGGFMGLAIVVLAPFAIWRDRGRVNLTPLQLRFMVLGAGLTLVLLWLVLLAVGGTAVKDRWLMPLAWVFVPVSVVWLWPSLRDGQRRVLGGIVMGLWALAMLCLPYATLRDPGYRSADFSALMAAIQEVQPGADVVASDSIWILGNLAHARPDLTLARPGNLPEAAFVMVSENGADIGPLAGKVGLAVPYMIAHGNRSKTVEIRAVLP